MFMYAGICVISAGAQSVRWYVRGWGQIQLHTRGPLVEDIWHHFLSRQGDISIVFWSI